MAEIDKAPTPQALATSLDTVVPGKEFDVATHEQNFAPFIRAVSDILGDSNSVEVRQKALSLIRSVNKLEKNGTGVDVQEFVDKEGILTSFEIKYPVEKGTDEVLKVDVVKQELKKERRPADNNRD